MESSANNDEDELSPRGRDGETRGKQDPRKEETEDEEEARRSTKLPPNQSKKERKQEAKGKRKQNKSNDSKSKPRYKRQSSYNLYNKATLPYAKSTSRNTTSHSIAKRTSV